MGVLPLKLSDSGRVTQWPSLSPLVFVQRERQGRRREVGEGTHTHTHTRTRTHAHIHTKNIETHTHTRGEREESIGALTQRHTEERE